MENVLPEIEIVDIKAVHANPENPRMIRDDKFIKLVESIKNFPEMLYLRPIIVDNSGMILGGNQRYEACKEIGYDRVPIIKAIDLSSEQRKKFIIKDNINSGSWNIDTLIDKWDADILEACDFDMNIIKEVTIVTDENQNNNQNENKEIDYTDIEDKMLIKITLSEDNYNCAMNVLRGISEDINSAFMELINDRTQI